MPAYRLPKGSKTPSVADFAIGGAMTAPIKALRSVDILRQVIGPRGSAKDLLGNPKALEMMEKMHAEANPVFKGMQQRGMFSNRLNPPSSMITDPTAAFESIPWRGLKQLKSMLGY